MVIDEHTGLYQGGNRRLIVRQRPTIHKSLNHTRRPASYMVDTHAVRVENQQVITDTFNPNITIQTHHNLAYPSRKHHFTPQLHRRSPEAEATPPLSRSRGRP